MTWRELIDRLLAIQENKQATCVSPGNYLGLFTG